MDQSEAPILDGLADYHRNQRYGFSPPAHRQGRGVDPAVLEVMGRDPFRDDLLASGGLDDRKSSNGYLKKAESDLLDVVSRCHPQTLRQLRWVNTMIKTLSPQALASLDA